MVHSTANLPFILQSAAQDCICGVDNDSNKDDACDESGGAHEPHAMINITSPLKFLEHTIRQQGKRHERKHMTT